MFTEIISDIKTELQALLFTAPVVLLAIICHECAHGLVSYRLGDPTAKNAGRLTLNPLKHLDPLGAICMLFFHVGWAKPVPINPMYYQNRRRGIIYVSMAGPIANFLLAFLSLLIEGLLMKYGSPSSVVIWILGQLCYYSAVVNVGLALFNLIPLPPLDGSNVLGSLSNKVQSFYLKYREHWRWILLLCVLSGALSKPLGLLNHLLVQSMRSIVDVILKHRLLLLF